MKTIYHIPDIAGAIEMYNDANNKQIIYTPVSFNENITTEEDQILQSDILDRCFEYIRDRIIYDHDTQQALLHKISQDGKYDINILWCELKIQRGFGEFDKHADPGLPIDNFKYCDVVKLMSNLNRRCVIYRGKFAGYTLETVSRWNMFSNAYLRLYK